MCLVLFSDNSHLGGDTTGVTMGEDKDGFLEPEFNEDGATVAGDEHNMEDASNANQDVIQGNKRYILFVGSLPYKATKEDILKHFAPTIPLSIRIRTDKATGRPKGFAFMDFNNPQDIQAALLKHHSKLMGRKINVELTAGGGGGGTNRRSKIKERNERLSAERAAANDSKTEDVSNKRNESKKK